MAGLEFEFRAQVEQGHGTLLEQFLQGFTVDDATGLAVGGECIAHDLELSQPAGTEIAILQPEGGDFHIGQCVRDVATDLAGGHQAHAEQMLQMM